MMPMMTLGIVVDGVSKETPETNQEAGGMRNGRWEIILYDLAPACNRFSSIQLKVLW